MLAAGHACNVHCKLVAAMSCFCAVPMWQSPSLTGAGADLLNKRLPVVQAKGKAELIIADFQAHGNHLSPDLQAGGWRWNYV